MTNEQFDSMVERLEQQGARHPARYKFRVFLLAALGYGFLFAILAILIGAVLLLGILAIKGHVGALAVKAMIPLGVVGWLVLRALWVKLDAPSGIALTRLQVPELFSELDNLRHALNGPRIDAVLLTDDFNAAVVQVPQLGVFGWMKNYLLIGLPLMQALSPEQLRAVLGHEYGHLAGAHGKFGAWIYRVRKTWYQLLEALEIRDGWLINIFKRFFKWYSPYFAAYTFVLARAEEYEADRCAAQVSGTRTAADALLNVWLKDAYLSECYWPDVYQSVEHEAEPRSAPHRLMPRGFRESIQSERVSTWLASALQRRTGTADTHPALVDRLHALGEAPRVPTVVETTAAERFLGAAMDTFIERLDTNWKQGIAQSWKERHEHVREGRKRLAELDSAATQGEQDLQQAWERACLREEFENSESALPLYRAILAVSPQDPAPLFAVGRILLSTGDSSGIEYMEKAIATDPELGGPGREWIAHYYESMGDVENARANSIRAEELREASAQAVAERAELRTSDSFIPHALTAEQIAGLGDQLRRYRKVGKAYLARKALERSPQPLYVLAIAYPALYFSWKEDTALAQQLAQEMNFPGETFVVVINGNQPGTDAEKAIGRKVRKVAQSLIYRRE